mmetsp:Transcript_20927/g.44761  ORF Transcript_20927/g.44761 Transcript_20927/m.44761 type:complete len:228 (+) Transcript_20927:284-967(+)
MSEAALPVLSLRRSGAASEEEGVPSERLRIGSSSSFESSLDDSSSRSATPPTSSSSGGASFIASCNARAMSASIRKLSSTANCARDSPLAISMAASKFNRLSDNSTSSPSRRPEGGSSSDRRPPEASSGGLSTGGRSSSEISSSIVPSSSSSSSHSSSSDDDPLAASTTAGFSGIGGATATRGAKRRLRKVNAAFSSSFASDFSASSFFCRGALSLPDVFELMADGC